MARFLSGWTSEQKLELLEFYERGRSLPGGHSMAGYIEAVSRDFFAAFSDQERMLVLSDGAKWPQSAVSVLAKLPPNPGSEMLAQLQRLDAQVAGVEGEAAAKLQIAIIAVLGRSDDPAAIAYLYDLFETQPARRSHIAMTLAQNPSQHARLLVRALPVLEGIFAQEVLMKLATVDYVPDEPEAARQVILRGLKLGEAGGNHAVAVLQRWTDQQLTPPDAPWNEALAAWQDWFRKAYPHLPPPELPRDSHTDRWTYDELLSLLTGPEAASGQADRGAAVFAKAQCAKCHRYGDLGDGIGPDLSTVSRRFQTKEILESILFPSQVISDQYASKTLLLTDGRVVSGMVIPAGTDAVTVLQASGEQISIARGDIEQTTASSKSAMPDGLLNPLTLEEILDLFAFLSTPPRESISSRRRP
jgi:putative heme-binding domain-containing protein